MILLPVLISELSEAVEPAFPFLSTQLPAIRNAMFGLVILLFLIFEPRGLARVWQRMKDYVRFWPFRY
jgi:branched-chain amino acid transport system permease protein